MSETIVVVYNDRTIAEALDLEGLRHFVGALYAAEAQFVAGDPHPVAVTVQTARALVTVGWRKHSPGR